MDQNNTELKVQMEDVEAYLRSKYPEKGSASAFHCSSYFAFYSLIHGTLIVI